LFDSFVVTQADVQLVGSCKRHLAPSTYSVRRMLKLLVSEDTEDVKLESAE
jgi:hypothetical protein